MTHLVPVPREARPTLAHLFQLYAHDFSELMPLALLPNGRFDVEPGDEWWTEPDHHAYFVYAEQALSGFALARRGSQRTGAADVMDVAEFFVVRAARRRSVGSEAAAALFETAPGKWEIRVRDANTTALAFWSRVAARHARDGVSQRPFTAKDAPWTLLSFEV